MDYRRLAFVDLETTGLGPDFNRILEIGIVCVDDGSVVSEWSSLLNPGGSVPAAIRFYTGLSDEMLDSAPRFEDIAAQIRDRLDGRVFLAHNARFDHGFLRSEFKRLGWDFSPEVVCTVALSRKLYPHHVLHNLDALMDRHGLSASPRHRALPDAQLIWQFWQCVQRELAPQQVTDALEAVAQAWQRSQQFNPELIDGIPAKHGAYVLHGEDRMPLHIGRSDNLRQRVLAHLNPAARSPRAVYLAHGTRDVSYYRTAGRLGSMLKETALMEEYSARDSGAAASPLLSWKSRTAATAGPLLELTSLHDCAPGPGTVLFGIYDSERKARNALRKKARTAGVCTLLAGLGASKKACDECGKKKSDPSACASDRRGPAARILSALTPLRVQEWPYAGAIGVKEKNEVHVINGWSYVGTARTDDQLHALLECRTHRFDLAVYRILVKQLPALPRTRLIPLGTADATTSAA
jgi:DNA polymerase-3 subunit epsilon